MIAALALLLADQSTRIHLPLAGRSQNREPGKRSAEIEAPPGIKITIATEFGYHTRNNTYPAFNCWMQAGYA